MNDDKKVQLTKVNLGNTGLKVSSLCLGTMTFGHKDGTNSWGLPVCNKETSFEIMDEFVKCGGNFIDTANAYGPGTSEEVIGEWMESRNNREQMIIATKVFFPMDHNNPNSGGLSRVSIMNNVEQSLKRLKTNYIDLYQCHAFDNNTPIEVTMRALNELIRSGKVRYIGCSNFKGWQIQKANDYAKNNGLDGFVTLQPQYSLMCRDIEWDGLEVAKNWNMGVLPWSPLKGGWLTGRYSRDMSEESLEGSRVGWGQKAGWKETDWQTQGTEQTWNIVESVKSIAENNKHSMAQVSLNWLIQKGTIPIIGARKMHHLTDNVGAGTGWSLSNEEMDKLDKVSNKEAPYPFRKLI